MYHIPLCATTYNKPLRTTVYTEVHEVLHNTSTCTTYYNRESDAKGKFSMSHHQNNIALLL